MAEEVRRVETVEERPRDTVVVKDGGRSNSGLIALAIVILLVILFFVAGNPFDGGGDTDINVDTPTPNVTVPTPDVNVQTPAE